MAIALEVSMQTGAHSVLVALCPEGEVCGAPPADRCRDEGTLKSMADYASATAGFLANVALGNTRPSDVTVPTLPAGGSVRVKTRFEIDPQAMLSLIGTLAADVLEAVKSGQKPAFAVPYMLEGALWVNLESFGKIAASFGPPTDVWTLAN